MGYRDLGRIVGGESVVCVFDRHDFVAGARGRGDRHVLLKKSKAVE